MATVGIEGLTLSTLNVPQHLGDERSNADWDALHRQVVLPVVFSKQLLVQSEKLRRRFTACSNFIQETTSTVYIMESDLTVIVSQSIEQSSLLTPLV